jgi:hypothetical protein
VIFGPPCGERIAGLLALVPDQRPAQRFAPEVPDLLRTVARNRSDESAVSKVR